MIKPFIIIDGQRLTAKDGKLMLDGKEISEKNEEVSTLSIANTVLKHIKANDKNMLEYKALMVKRGSTARFK